jgi:hypothetical protein
MPDYQITIDGETLHGLFQGDAGLAKLLEQVLNQVLEAQVSEQLGRSATSAPRSGRGIATACVPAGSPRAGGPVLSRALRPLPAQRTGLRPFQGKTPSTVTIFLSFSTTDLDTTGHYLGALAVSNRWHTRPLCETLFLAPVGLIGA